jgi:uncharacterized protein YceK
MKHIMMNDPKKFLCILALASLAPALQAAPTLTTIYTFTGAADGGSPGAGLLQGRHGNLFGTTEAGGQDGVGTVFQLSPPHAASASYTLTTLHSFAGGSDGNDPTNIVMDVFGNIYGVTSAGGGSTACGSGCGTVFQLRPPAPGQTAWTESVLYAFNGASDGHFPNGLSIDAFGNLYGFTWGGDGTCSSGCGTVYQLSPPLFGHGAWRYTRLYTFTNIQDGKGPFGNPLLDVFGDIYGIAYSGGPSAPGGCAPFSGCGEVFKLTPPWFSYGASSAWTKSTIWSFNGGNGTGAFNSLSMDERGDILGLTNEGGINTSNCPQIPNSNPAGCGTAFELRHPAYPGAPWTQQMIWNFSGTGDSGFPADSALVTVHDGYVASTSGGGNDPSGQYGSIVEFIPPTPGRSNWTEQTLFTFSNDANGAVPVGVLLYADGAVYGTTYGYSGAAASGTVFKITQ